jgi:hypothetical protein
MTVKEKTEVTTLLRALSPGPEPTREYRQRAWRAFEEALERHLADKRGAVKQRQTRR